MREIRTYGSEGGVVQDNALSLPLSVVQRKGNCWAEAQQQYYCSAFAIFPVDLFRYLEKDFVIFFHVPWVEMYLIVGAGPCACP